jgi:hypothetical protein
VTGRLPFEILTVSVNARRTRSWCGLAPMSAEYRFVNPVVNTTARYRRAVTATEERRLGACAGN